MRRLLTGASAFIALLIVLSGCSNNSGGAPPTATEASQQANLTQQGIANGPKGGGGEAARQAELTKQGAGGSATPSTPGH